MTEVLFDKNEFSLSTYKNIVLSLLGDGYSVSDFKNAASEKRHLILRHDVDMSLEYAERMAQAEFEIGVSSTYFVLVRTRMYNPFFKENHKRIESIISMGHEVGLHFDASNYASDHDSIQRAVEDECKLLEYITQKDVSTVSFHRPRKDLYGYAGTLGGRIHAYQPKFFHDMEYCSDSRGGWFHGHPLDRALGRSMQLLTHPIWWALDPTSTVQEKLVSYVGEEDNSFREELARNCEAYIFSGKRS